MDFTYHDTRRVQYILDNGFDNVQIYNDMRLLVLYYRDVLGYKPKQRKLALIDFLQHNLEDYNEVLYYNVIHKALNNAVHKDRKLIDIDNIPITKSEMEYIDNLPLEHNAKKVIFTMLVRIKISKCIQQILSGEKTDEFYLNKKLTINKILKYANLSVTKSNKSIFYELNVNGYVTPYPTGGVKVDILYNIPKDEEVALLIEDYENIGYYYDYYFHIGNIKLCKECHRPFNATQNGMLYCTEHRIKEPSERVVECVDCGLRFKVNPQATHVIRCEKCQAIKNREYEKIKKRKQRAKTQ